MASRSTARRLGTLPLSLILLLLLAACSRNPTPAQQRLSAGEQSNGVRPIKSVVLAVRGAIQAMSIAGDLTTSGGWQSVNELHANGLITAGVDSRAPVPRLAERVPTFDDGTIKLLPDGRMQLVYPLRQGVTWHDGTAFTSKDLLFSFKLQIDEGIPVMDRKLGRQLLHSAEAPDDYTFVLYFTGPYYRADALGPRLFWVHPQHVLQGAHQKYLGSGDANDLLQVPYWTTEYVHLGPFRLVAFDPGERLSFEAYDGYFLGRPKIDAVHVRTFHSESTQFASLLAGAVDLFMDGTLSTELGHQLLELWQRTGEGAVYGKLDSSRLLEVQWRPGLQTEPANLDPKVRAALYHAIDRPALASALQVGRAELAATSVLPPSERPYPATRDGLLQYQYDPGRAVAALQETGWTAGPDGMLRYAGDGRRYRTALWADVSSDNEIAIIADYWRRIGVEVTEYTVAGAQARDREFRSSFPGWYVTGNYGESILNRLQGPPASRENRWSGNRSGYDDARGQRLLDAYYGSITEPEQLRTARALSDYIAAELPILPLYWEVDYLGARQEIKALDDVAGGAAAGAPYGTYTRHAHLWDRR